MKITQKELDNLPNLNRFHNKFFGSIVSYEDLDSMNIEALILIKHKIIKYLD